MLFATIPFFIIPFTFKFTEGLISTTLNVFNAFRSPQSTTLGIDKSVTAKADVSLNKSNLGNLGGGNDILSKNKVNNSNPLAKTSRLKTGEIDRLTSSARTSTNNMTGTNDVDGVQRKLNDLDVSKVSSTRQNSTATATPTASNTSSTASQSTLNGRRINQSQSGAKVDIKPQPTTVVGKASIDGSKIVGQNRPLGTSDKITFGNPSPSKQTTGTELNGRRIVTLDKDSIDGLASTVGFNSNPASNKIKEHKDDLVPTTPELESENKIKDNVSEFDGLSKKNLNSESGDNIPGSAELIGRRINEEVQHNDRVSSVDELNSSNSISSDTNELSKNNETNSATGVVEPVELKPEDITPDVQQTVDLNYVDNHDVDVLTGRKITS